MSDTVLGKDQLAAWTGQFGRDFMERRGPEEEFIRQRTIAFSQIFIKLQQHQPKSILEVGPNIGLNLRALRRISGAEQFAVEPNPAAIEILLKDGVLPETNIKESTIYDIPYADRSMDLAFTFGVLIHIPPEGLDKAYKEIYRVAKDYILCGEYHNPTPVEVNYRGRDGLLFKRDFGREWLERYPDLQLMDHGFFWDYTTGVGDITWWLFRKP